MDVLRSQVDLAPLELTLRDAYGAIILQFGPTVAVQASDRGKKGESWSTRHHEGVAHLLPKPLDLLSSLGCMHQAVGRLLANFSSSIDASQELAPLMRPSQSAGYAALDKQLSEDRAISQQDEEASSQKPLLEDASGLQSPTAGGSTATK